MDSLEGFEVYDNLIETPMADLGWQCELISWRDQSVDWNTFDAVIIRSPWDYQNDAPAFLKVLANIEDSTAHLENSLRIVNWNIDKKYLKELEQYQVSIVPTLWREQLCTADIATFFQQLNTKQIVIKPRISANADNTFWLTKENYLQFSSALEHAFAKSEFLVQPFMKNIISEGEFSLFYFNGHYSHAILKTPKDDDFRVQEEHGGRLQAITPEASLFEHAKSTLKSIKTLIGMPLYARIDFVRSEAGFALMEAELIEPSLYFNTDAQSPERFAQAFVDRMKSLNL